MYILRFTMLANKKHCKIYGFQKSKTPGMMYDALIRDYWVNVMYRVPFGCEGECFYKDKTGLNLYSNLATLDKNYRDEYRSKCLAHIERNPFSSQSLNLKFLW